jgi:hypothetical protein
LLRLLTALYATALSDITSLLSFFSTEQLVSVQEKESLGLCPADNVRPVFVTVWDISVDFRCLLKFGGVAWLGFGERRCVVWMMVMI